MLFVAVLGYSRAATYERFAAKDTTTGAKAWLPRSSISVA